jgi:ABC-2 type transport system permease protein
VIRLLRAETRKVLTTKLWWGMLLGALTLTALAVVGQIASNGTRGNPAGPLTDPTTQRSLFASSSAGAIFSMVVGIILTTTEYRHFTSRPTFLIEPRRGRVIAAKVVITAVVGLVYGVACIGLTTAIAATWLNAKGISLLWSDAGIVSTMLGSVISVTLFGIIGVGVGVLIRNQVAAVIAALAYRFIAEGLISVIPYAKEAYRYLPGAAANALVNQRPRSDADILEPWQGGLVLLGWGVLFTVVGYVITARRDIA